MLPASPPLPSPPHPSTIIGFCISVYLLSPTSCHTAPPPSQGMHPCTASIHPPQFPSPRLAPHITSLPSHYTLPSYQPCLSTTYYSLVPLSSSPSTSSCGPQRRPVWLCGDTLSRQRFAVLHPPELMLPHHQ